ncbi:MAG: GTPase HflX [Lachnospiraceae bacterium]|jgi:GTP-binding protein HflX|nr:GTPase HflX [Lachnospiraceae bacterium]
MRDDPAENLGILIGAALEDTEDIDRELRETWDLATAAGIFILKSISQTLVRPNAATLFGSGKIEEIRAEKERLAEASGRSIDVVICHNTLSPKQHRNLTESFHCEVIDRTGLILMIFAERARTREAKLQVESAQLAYLLPRLAGLHEGLSRQGGASGPLSGKGAGEKQIELDRRRIEHRMDELRRELDGVEKERAIQRRRRMRERIPRVSLIGYTNAGKSTIMNALLSLSGADAEKQVYAEDMLFATLDTTVRRIRADRSRIGFLLSDTVGLIEHLPHTLVKAFRSTLEEACYADLLLIVVDLSDRESYDRHIRTTIDTLAEIGASDIPRLFVFNKVDLTDFSRGQRISCDRLQADDMQILMSGRDPEDIGRLYDAILDCLRQGYQETELRIPYDRGDAVSTLCDRYEVLSQTHEADGTLLRVLLDPAGVKEFGAWITVPPALRKP